jgi:hypothetical protein
VAQISICDVVLLTDEKPVPQILFSGPVASWPVECGNFLTDYRIVGGFIDIDLRPVLILFRHVVVGEDCFDRTLRYTRIAIDARVGINIKTVRQFMKCFDRTNGRAVSVLTINTRLSNDVRHFSMTPFKD